MDYKVYYSNPLFCWSTQLSVNAVRSASRLQALLLAMIVFAHRYTYRCATHMPEMHIGRSMLMWLLHHIYINMYITNCSWRDMNRIALWQAFVCWSCLTTATLWQWLTAHVRWVQGEPKQEQCDVLLIKLCYPCLYFLMSKPVMTSCRTFTVTAPVYLTRF